MGLSPHIYINSVEQFNLIVNSDERVAEMRPYMERIHHSQEERKEVESGTQYIAQPYKPPTPRVALPALPMSSPRVEINVAEEEHPLQL